VSLKILGGDFRGFQIQVPKNSKTRPTSVMLRRRLFDRRQNLEGVVFVDLCAGTGSMAFEALSRGATKAIMSENNRIMSALLEQNINLLKKKFSHIEILLFKGKIETYLSNLKKELKNFDEEVIIFFDPPYSEVGLYELILKDLSSWYLGEIWVEYDEELVSQGLFEQFHLKVHKTLKQSSSSLIIGSFQNS
jgi:16S rRNA (guanine966-N2)-methyltransferase